MKKFVPKDNWENRKRINPTAAIPYAYKPSPNDVMLLEPDLDLIYYVEQALDAMDIGESTRNAAEWLSKISGESISHAGLLNIWKRYREKGDSPRAKEMRERKKRNKPKTWNEKVEKETVLKLASAKRSQIAQKKRLEKIREKKYQDNPELRPVEPVSIVDYSTVETEDERESVFTPNPGPQEAFLAASQQEVLYGGAAGGGKSYGLLADPMRYFDNKNFNGIILRRTNDELRELKWKSKILYGKAYPKAVWKEKDSMWVFPSGAQLWMTYLERDDDVLRYQGQSFSYIAFDELTQYSTPFAWDYMRSRLRTTDPDLPTYMRATTNPGGPGHGWVKKMFIDPAPPNKPFWARDIDTGEILTYPDMANGKPHPKAGKPLFQRLFIPASLYDNPYLTADGNYEANLLSLPEHQRRQLLEGDWSIADGAAFPEFRPSLHTCKPFDIPSSWRRFRSCDYGYSSHAAVHWYAIDPIYETLYVYREFYTSKMTARPFARKVLELERDEKISYGVLDSSVWHQRGGEGPSIAEEMIAEGCRWRPSDRSKGSRESGYNRLHELLTPKQVGIDENGVLQYKPGIVFFDTCRQIISDIPVIPSDPDGKDDIDDRYASDHAYDSIRYGIMSRPRANSVFDFGTNMMAPSYRPADPSFGY